MTKLAQEFSAQLDVGNAFSGIAGIGKLMAFPDGRAVAFGWGTQSGDYGLACHWLADIRRDHVSYRVLPRELSQRCRQVLGNPGGGSSAETGIVAFKLGDQVGLLLGSTLVYLYRAIDAEPLVIEVENGFSLLSSPKHPSWKEDSQFRPVHCGSPAGTRVPVVFSSPQDDDGDGRYACLLEIDVDGRSARWLNTDAEGAPHSTVGEEYIQFDCGGSAGAQRLVNGKFVLDRRPLIDDCAWINNCWMLYVAGFHHFRVRFGARPCALTRNLADMSMVEAVFEPQDQSLGRICASQDRMILTPLRKNGPRKGKQTLYLLEQREEVPLVLPRGHAKAVVEEYCDGLYWLTPDLLRSSHMPLTLLACSQI